MDLTTLSFIVIVLFFSLLSMLFISRFLPKGKSFEEMLKEKREMREKILGLTSPSSAPSTKSSKESANKRTKKTQNSGNSNTNQSQKNRGGKQQQQQQQQQHQRVEVVEPESDGNSSESPLEEEINPLTYGAKKRTGQATNLTVEYAETEAFPLNDNVSGNKKKDNKQQQQGGKKNKQKSTGGILVNKSEPVLVKAVETVPEINHFAEIHPKDALEIARQQKYEEDAKSGKHLTPKDQRQQNKNKKDHHQSKLSPKGNAPAAAKATEQQQQQHHATPTNAVVQHASEPKKQPVDNKSTATAAPIIAQKDNKLNKRKKNELITQELAVEMADAVNVHSLVNILNKADLPRNDIQILIDFLLNKQQDTLAKDPSEWNDPSDPLQKLKKQLQEKEAALLEEQQAAAGLQAKLKDLRQELNGEKVQAGAMQKGYAEELNNKKQELHHLTLELNATKDKLVAEKQSMSMQFQQLQAKYIQLSKEQAATQDHGTTIAQLNNDLQLLQQELMVKSQLLNEKLQSEEEMKKKKTEYEIILHNNDELLTRHVQELTAYENELRQLRLELSQKDELSQTCQQQSYEIEQLKAELQAKQKQAVAAASAAAAAAHATSQADESNRVEIRNLENALDSTKSKLEVFRSELVECKSLMTDYKQQVTELQAKEELLQKQLDEQRQKNDEQQQKLANSNAEKVDVGKVILEEQNRTKDLLVQLLQPTGVVSALPENMLKNLEAKVIEQDIHWRTVVQAKDKELTLLKSAGAVAQ
uniref:Ribosome receptor lysine/proline rich domain-containing protein n=1 Tax=Anopheles farauti TaxID=69004 RepID=A0A182QRZ9_9DIPT